MKLNIKVPTTLNDITLRQYKTFLNIQTTVKDEKFLSIKLIEIFCNIKASEVVLLKFKDSELISNSINKLFEDKPKLVTRFKISNKEYGFHPQLDDLTLGEYVDLDTYIGDWENIEKAMSVLYRPIVASLKGKYSVSEYEIGKEEALLDMPMDAVLSSIFFFWNLGLDLSKTMMSYLEQEKVEGTEALTDFLNSQQSGVGINPSMHSLKVILQDLKISLN
tara:strand:- start:5255 stop:5914 length:660 start_codon:yes stop_codon:yes gene_type:complete